MYLQKLSQRTFSYYKKDIAIIFIPTYRIRQKGETSREVASHIVIKQRENKYQLISSGNSLFSPRCYEPEVEWIAGDNFVFGILPSVEMVPKSSGETHDFLQQKITSDVIIDIILLVIL